MRSLRPGLAEDVDLEAAYVVDDGLPWHLRASFISSADGAVTLDGRAGGLGGPGDRAVFAVLRDLSDVVLVGAGTARAEGYRSQRPTEDRIRRRRRHGLPDGPVLALVSERLALDPTGDLFRSGDPRTVVITHRGAPEDRRHALAEVADIVFAGEREVDLGLAVAALRERGFRRAHCEGGPRLFAAALAAGQVDELCLTIAGLLTGSGAGRIVTGLGLPAPIRLALMHVLEEEGDLFLRYDLRG